MTWLRFGGAFFFGVRGAIAAVVVPCLDPRLSPCLAGDKPRPKMQHLSVDHPEPGLRRALAAQGGDPALLNL